MSNNGEEILRQMSADFDGSEHDFVPTEEDKIPVKLDKSVGSVVGQVRKGAGLSSQNNFREFTLKKDDDSEKPRRRKKAHHAPEDPAVLRALRAAELLREREIAAGTHFSVRNLMENVEVPAGVTHQITGGALEGQYVVIVGSGEKGSVKVTIVGGRRNGSPAFIMPADLKKL